MDLSYEKMATPPDFGHLFLRKSSETPIFIVFLALFNFLKKTAHSAEPGLFFNKGAQNCRNMPFFVFWVLSAEMLNMLNMFGDDF